MKKADKSAVAGWNRGDDPIAPAAPGAPVAARFRTGAGAVRGQRGRGRTFRVRLPVPKEGA